MPSGASNVLDRAYACSPQELNHLPKPAIKRIRFEPLNSQSKVRDAERKNEKTIRLILRSLTPYRYGWPDRSLSAAGRKLNDVCGGPFWRGLCWSLPTARYGDARRSRLARAKNSSPPVSPSSRPAALSVTSLPKFPFQKTAACCQHL